MIFPTLRIERRGIQGSDLHGQPVLGLPTFEMVAPVKLQFGAQHTTVRTDSSASHGQAYEGTANIVVLARPASKIATDDVLTILGRKVKVSETHNRYTVTGVLDHIEVRCIMWK